jgi:hypothetical protein
VAVRDVVVGTAITPDDVAVRWVAAGQGAPGVLHAPEAAVGQRARLGLVAGQQVLERQVTRGSPDFGLDRAERAVLIPQDGVSMRGVLAAGDRVDLVWVRESGPEWLTRGARVLLVQQADEEREGGVVVAVSERVAPTVAAAVMRGEVALCLSPVAKEGS